MWGGGGYGEGEWGVGVRGMTYEVADQRWAMDKVGSAAGKGSGWGRGGMRPASQGRASTLMTFGTSVVETMTLCARGVGEVAVEEEGQFTRRRKKGLAGELSSSPSLAPLRLHALRLRKRERNR